MSNAHVPVATCVSEAGVYRAHYWELTLVRINGLLYDHHYCMRCGAQKDVLSTMSKAPSLRAYRRMKADA